jgi:hypothetical protein
MAAGVTKDSHHEIHALHSLNEPILELVGNQKPRSCGDIEEISAKHDQSGRALVVE